MEHGTVKWFSEEKGYGFIQSDVAGKEYFVHATDLLGDSISEGDRVEFETSQGQKGPEARNVKLLN